MGDTAQLYFYDLEPNVIPIQDGVDRVSAANLDQQTAPRLYDAVKLASEQPESCDKVCTVTGPRLLPLRQGDEGAGRRARVGQAGPLRRARGAGPARRTSRRSSRSSPGTIVVRDNLTSGDDTAEATSSVDRYFVLRDRPSLSGDDLRNPEQNFDPQTNEPNVTFDFTDEGQEKFQEVTKGIAERGLENFPPQPESFAIVLDDEMVSRPVIDPNENPEGIDGRTGAQISGGFDITEAQDLANFLRIGALPVELQLTSSSTVSATLGQQALDQAPEGRDRGPDPGDPLPDRLLPVPRPRRRARPDRLRDLLLRA